jgi:glutaredoxin
LNTQVLGISVDHIPCLKAWADSLGGIHFPLLSDFWPHGVVSKDYDVLRPEGYSERAIFIIDKDGIIRYIDVHDIDNQPSNEVLRQELQRLTPQAAPPLSPAVAPKDPSLPHGGIVMYCTKWCPDCRRARVWFSARNLDFVEVDIDAVPGAAAQVKAWTGGKRITPTFEIDGKIIIDFNEKKLTEALQDRLTPTTP